MIRIRLRVISLRTGKGMTVKLLTCDRGCTVLMFMSQSNIVCIYNLPPPKCKEQIRLNHTHLWLHMLQLSSIWYVPTTEKCRKLLDMSSLFFRFSKGCLVFFIHKESSEWIIESQVFLQSSDSAPRPPPPPPLSSQQVVSVSQSSWVSSVELTGNLKSENSQDDYAQNPQWNCMFMNSASGLNPNILRHSGIWGAADEAALNEVIKKLWDK